jgi:hypothetical protein
MSEKLRPMDEAPKDGTEILAYQIDGESLHQVQWREHRERWTMRWNSDYEQRDSHYLGWIPMPDVG